MSRDELQVLGMRLSLRARQASLWLTAAYPGKWVRGQVWEMFAIATMVALVGWIAIQVLAR